ncbi:8229_t:CDS:2, partial [Racocetra fulgida]
QVHKYPNAKYEKFPTLKEAQAFMSGVSNSEKEPGLANNKPVENQDLFVRLVELIEARPGKTHVPGHVGIPGNEAADRLANLGALKEEVETTTVSSAEKISQNSIMNFTEDDFYSPEELTEIAAEVYSLRR